MKKIAVIGGDGTGPEVVNEGLKCLKAVAEKIGFKYTTREFDWGGDRYLKTGEVLPSDFAETLKNFDAILLGAIGHPDVKPGILEQGILLSLRRALDQYINLRPVKLYPGVETLWPARAGRYRFRGCSRKYRRALCGIRRFSKKRDSGRGGNSGICKYSDGG